MAAENKKEKEIPGIIACRYAKRYLATRGTVYNKYIIAKHYNNTNRLQIFVFFSLGPVLIRPLGDNRSCKLSKVVCSLWTITSN